MFRERTTRKNVAYRVVDISEFGRKADKEEFVLALIEKKVRDAEGVGKVVVYCNSTTKVRTIADGLSCDAFYHDAVGKEAMLEDFRTGKRRVIMATNALGIGIDIPDIRCIVHADRPRTLLDYAQESGRAGRDGRRSEAIVVEDRAESKWLEREQTEEEKRLVKKYVGSSEEAVKGLDVKKGRRSVTFARGLEKKEEKEKKK
ncbi:hypothetical protein H2199_006607 [Coniosporium tulheliwenetii]|uniref:Uncharacterized protein n=1 Tax=Coniosporium tulheliwenetii TaxID=3383036 RepID=A0ACC2YW49_9PEZI|nr:hypothetical protein H2199_006607 [Cladosporium sp. JES 115]